MFQGLPIWFPRASQSHPAQPTPTFALLLVKVLLPGFDRGSVKIQVTLEVELAFQYEQESQGSPDQRNLFLGTVKKVMLTALNSHTTSEEMKGP